MASIGPLYPGTVTTEVGPSGDNDWTNPGNVSAADSTEAQITAATYDAGDHSYRLKATNFGFTVPSGATIDGIIVEINRRDFAGDAQDQEVRIYNASGTLVGDDKQTATSWPATLTTETYGTSTDTWNAGLTDTDVNSTNFGVALIVLANSANTDIGVDFIRVTVHYTAPATVSGSFTADAAISKVGIAGTLTADANISKTDIAGSITADAYIRTTTSGSFTADAAVSVETAGSFTADANISVLGIPGSITADAQIQSTIAGSFTADAHLSANGIAGSFTADAEIQGTAPSVPVWVSPADTVPITATPVFVFTIPSGPAGNYHFHLELDTVNTFNSGSLQSFRSHVDQTGWEYWNGSVWTPVTAAGVSSTYSGNDARYTVQTPLSAGIWYRRVRVGV